VKPVLEPVKTARIRQKRTEPELGRNAAKDPGQVRRLARDKDLKPTRSVDSRHETAQADETTPKRKPSRAGRSMKSRQSESRGSKAGGKHTKPRQSVKPPIALMAVAAILTVVGLILLPRAYQPSTQDAAEVRLPSAVRANTITQPRTVGATVITAKPRQTQGPAMNLTPAREIWLGQIAGFETGIPAVILFRDGSKLPVDPVTLEQLSAEVRLQLTYTRERQ
jgi:hypothetical protein